ncbi:FbpB family small basic protein [Pueribacillus theae]|uniref:FbpB family small basic protein n=1 Tax=Pueribacillus theae TaxID=2171751 RepID=A0A2U1K6T0_9BACI|nr:FbpB family small basic protein [Pueribacillus theae]PWA13230.1 FbpB family small basic protein [Pueribacillus theae]
MRKVKMFTFKELVSKNKEELLRNNKEMERIEKQIDEKHSRKIKVERAGSGSY